MRSHRKVFVAGLALALTSVAVVGCPLEVTHFGWTYSVGSDVTAAFIARSSQGGYFVTGRGRASSAAASPYSSMVLKLSEAGQIQWSQFISGMLGALAVTVPDGGMVLSGYTGTSASTYQRYFSKLDQSGNLTWRYAYGETGSGALVPGAMVATGDGGCVIAGMRYNGSETLPFVMRLDPQGGVVWERHMAHEVGFLNVTKMAFANGGGFIISGVGSPYVGRLLKVNDEGLPLWWKQYDGSWDGADGFNVAVAADGGFVIAGASGPSRDATVPVVVRTDADGNVLWTVDDVVSTVSTPYLRTRYTAHDVLVDGEGRIVVTGELLTSRRGLLEWATTGQGYMMQFDSAGNLNWNTSLSTGVNDGQFVRRVTQTESSDYITVGQTRSGEIQVIRVSKTGAIM